MSPDTPADRLAHVIYHLGIGGGEQFLADLAPALAARGLRQHVWCVGPAGPLAAPLSAASVPVTALRKRTQAGLGALTRLVRDLRRYRPATVLVHGEAGIIWGLPAAAAAGAPVRVAVVYQNYDETRLRMTAMTRLLPLATHVVAGSASVAAFVAHRFGIERTHLSAVLCGIDLDRLRGIRRPGGDRPTTLLSLGRLVPRKGHEVLLRAVALLRDAGLAFRVLMVGDGPSRDDLVRLAGELRIIDRVEFRRAIWPDTPLWAEADVFVFPSLIEPQGLVVLEAFASRVPVVASGVGGIPEMVDNERSGLLVPPGDPAALARAIDRVLREPGLASRLVEGGTQRVDAFDIGHTASTYVALLRRLLAERDAERHGPGRPHA